MLDRTSVSLISTVSRTGLSSWLYSKEGKLSSIQHQGKRVKMRFQR